jgi:hypothetical protein
LHGRTTPVNNVTPQELDELYKQQDAAMKQLGQSYTQQQPYPTPQQQYQQQYSNWEA